MAGLFYGQEGQYATDPLVNLNILRIGPAWTQQRTQKIDIVLIHVAVGIRIHPPTTAIIAGIRGAKLSLQSRWTSHFQQLEIIGSVVRQISQYDGIVVQTLRTDVDDRASGCCSALGPILGKYAGRHKGNSAGEGNRG